MSRLQILHLSALTLAVLHGCDTGRAHERPHARFTSEAATRSSPNTPADRRSASNGSTHNAPQSAVTRSSAETSGESKVGETPKAIVVVPPSTPTSDANRDATAQSTRFPPRWSADLGLAALADVDQLLAAEAADQFGDLELAGETIHPTTCSERTALHARGFTPPTTIDGQDDEAGKVRCESLRLLKRARSSRFSYVRKLPWNARLLGLLPATIASTLDPAKERAAREATAAGRSFLEFDPRATAKRARAPQSLEILEGDHDGVIFIYPMGWADIDADGVEDLIASITNADAHGPMTSTRLVLLARLGDNQPLVWKQAF